MVNRGITNDDLFTAVGTILACGAMLIAWLTRKETFWRLTLAFASAFGLVALTLAGVHAGRLPFSAPAMALAATGTATGLWGLVYGPRTRFSLILHALAVALGLGAFLLDPTLAWDRQHRWGTLFGLAEIAYVLGAAALWNGVISTATLRNDASRTRLAFRAALLLVSTSLLLYGLGAQRAWGAYWSWEPFACWRLATWLVVALAASLAEHLGWASRWATLSLWIAACFSLGVLLGSLPLVQGLGLNGQY